MKNSFLPWRQPCAHVFSWPCQQENLATTIPVVASKTGDPWLPSSVPFCAGEFTNGDGIFAETSALFLARRPCFFFATSSVFGLKWSVISTANPWRELTIHSRAHSRQCRGCGQVVASWSEVVRQWQRRRQQINHETSGGGGVNSWGLSGCNELLRQCYYH